MIELRLLGRLSLTGADGRDVRALLGQPRRLALLAYLAAATPPGFHRRDSLLVLFWPELDQEHARAALRQALHVVRDALGARAVTSRGDEEIGLDFAEVSCDVPAFERAHGKGQLEEALDLYRGALLEGFFISDAPDFERWLETARARLQQAAAGAARTLAERHESANDLARAVRWTRRATELAPSDEGLVRLLMALLDRQGNRAGAFEAYKALARRVAADYDAEPAAETKALLAEVRERSQSQETAGPLAPVDREEHRPSSPRRARLGISAGIFAAAVLVLRAPGRIRDVLPSGRTHQQCRGVRFVPTRQHACEPASESRERFARDHAVRADRRAGPELCRGSGRARARLRAARE